MPPMAARLPNSPHKGRTMQNDLPGLPQNPDPEIEEAAPEPAPMLDIHDAHHAASTWKDFFIHIATICLGLLIAIGLEQTVEAIHHARERRELVADMRQEAEQNVVTIHRDIDASLGHAAWNIAAMKVLEHAQPRGGVLTVTLPARAAIPPTTAPDRAVWSIAQANGKAALLTEKEAETYARLDIEDEKLQQVEQRGANALVEGNELLVRLHIDLSPGKTITVPAAELPDLLNALAARVVTRNDDAQRQAIMAGAAQAIAHGVWLGPEFYKDMENQGDATQARIAKE
jgi:hypothetical protein